MSTLPTGLNFILVTLVVIASSITILQTMRDPVTNSSRWIPISVGLIVLAALLLLILPPYAGYISTGAWLLVGIVPSLGFRLSNHFHYRGQYARARRIKLWLRWLHPLPDWAWQDAVFQAYMHLDAGARDQVTTVLQQAFTQITATPEREVLIFVLSHDWQGLVAWWETHPQQTALTQRPDVIRHYLRALGEIGQLDDMVATFLHYQTVLMRVPLILNYAYLYLFAFGGKVDQTTQLLNERLAETLNPDAHILWIATAHGAAKNGEMSRALLRPILRTTQNGLTKFTVEQRLGHDPVPAHDHLSSANATALQTIINNWTERNQLLSLWH